VSLTVSSSAASGVGREPMWSPPSIRFSTRPANQAGTLSRIGRPPGPARHETSVDLSAWSPVSPPKSQAGRSWSRRREGPRVGLRARASTSWAARRTGQS
jgi:hypothetical protein